MTNREWLLNKMQNMSDEELAKVLDVRDIICQNTYTYSDCVNNRKDCKNCVLNWLKAEYKEKITLSEAERVILENINKKYKWICRTKDGNIYIASGTEAPLKEDDMWKVYFPNENDRLKIFNHLFQFITWNDSEPYNIAELLKGE